MNLDTRAKRLAKILVDYSLSITKKDTLMVQCEDVFSSFAEYVGRLTEKKNASVIYELFNLKEKRKMINRNNKEELKKESKRLCEIAEKVTARVRIDSDSNPYYLGGINPKKIADYTSIVNKPLLDRIVGDGKKFKEKKWTVAAFPCEAEAKKAGMSLREYNNFVYSATNINWKKKRAEMVKIKKIFDNAKDVHIIIPDFTNIHLSLKGRGGHVSDGMHNMPDGEVYYCPLENSANGYIYFPYKTVRDGNAVSGIRLEYRGGKIVDFSAKENQKFLESMLNLKGAKRIGELGIGCNYSIKKYTNKLLFDEKIGGTIHLAIGESYSRPLSSGGGKNKADIHWDLVCDLRKENGLPGGEIYVDGKPVQKNGKWVF